jgi:hypothetical protein
MPKVANNNQSVERTDRSFVHSDLITAGNSKARGA